MTPSPLILPHGYSWYRNSVKTIVFTATTEADLWAWSMSNNSAGVHHRSGAGQLFGFVSEEDVNVSGLRTSFLAEI